MNRQKKMRSKLSGISLLELMMAVAIVAVLASVSYPSYRSYVDKTERVDAMGGLMSFANAMERFYTVNNTYVGVCSGTAGTAGTPPCSPHSSVFSEGSPIDAASADKKYLFWVTGEATSSYTLTAALKACGSSVSSCKGRITIDNTGTKFWDEDQDATLDADENEWDQG